MSPYTLTIRIPNAGNREFSHSITLTPLQESYPEDYFRLTDASTQLRTSIETQSARTISPPQLISIVTQWTAEIRCGLHQTTIVLNLAIVTSTQTTELPLSTKLPPRSQVTQPTLQHPTTLADSNRAEF